ncbi:hypothetical protein [Novibacillus thermophilus]|uniref:hypothetical protein n=1 Tax=Novibacillus thermophilus TaxID=1471761 RepID=UPI0014758D3C|nr:hypothetical protein [Novibacillus thermophilus]
MLKSLCGKPLRRALNEFGFPTLRETVFTEQDIHAFHRHMPELPASYTLTAKLLAHSLDGGKIVDVNTLRDGTTVWTVSFKCWHYVCQCDFAHRHGTWKTTGTPRMQRLQGALKWMPSAWYARFKHPFIFDAAAIALLVVVSFALGSVWARDAGGTPAVKAADPDVVLPEEAVKVVEDEGYLVMTPKERDHLIQQAQATAYAQAEQEMTAKVEETRKQADQNIAAKVEEKQTEEGEEEDRDNHQTEKVLVYSMREGMPIQDLVKALHKHDFIDDTQAFLKRLEQEDLETKVKIGDYEFTSDMSEDAIIQTLKSK